MAHMTANKVLAAGALGFLAGILLAPDKGTETQAKIKQKAHDMQDDMKMKADKVRGKMRDMKQKDESVLDKVDQKIDEAAKAVA